MFSEILTTVFAPAMALLVWYVRKSVELSIKKFELEAKLNQIPYSKRIAFDRVIQEQLNKLQKEQDADAIVYCKVHNGEFYADKKHVLKFSAVLESTKNNESCKEKLQNRLISDAAILFADLDKDGVAFGEENKFTCEGFSRILKSLGFAAFTAAQLSNDGLPIAIVFAFYRNNISDETLANSAKWLQQEFNTLKSSII